MTDNIRLMTQYEINKLQNKVNVPIYGTYDFIFESEIAIGCDNPTDKRLMQTLNHETIHETLTEFLNKSVSFLFDRLYYSESHNSLKELFTIEEQTFI